MTGSSIFIMMSLMNLKIIKRLLIYAFDHFDVLSVRPVNII